MSPLLALITILICLLLLGESSLASPAPTSSQKEYVVLLHGLGRTPLSMKKLERHLSGHGYVVINASYPSTRFSVQELADIHLHCILSKRVESSARVHFVTHSLGGILVRQYLSNHTVANLGRVVMLAPPNQGSEIIDFLRNNRLASCILGPGGMQLGTRTNDLTQSLGRIPFEGGVIACDRSLNPILSRLFPGPNDGKVSVERTKVEGMNDFLLLHSSHTWMMWRKETLDQTVCFLQTGRFTHAHSLVSISAPALK